MIIKKLCQLFAVTLCMSLISFASAHEMRHICDGGDTIGNEACEDQADTLMFHVGFATEPAWATDSNGVNINISWHPDAAHDAALTQKVNTAAGDTVKLDSVVVQYFGKENRYKPGMRVKRSLMVYSGDQNSPVSQNQPDANGNIAKKFGTDNVYNSYFRPEKEGVYGFVIKGMVTHIDTINLTEHSFDFSEDGLTFICGVKGTQDTAGTSKFGCVQKELAIR